MEARNPNRPRGSLNPQGEFIPQSFQDLAYRGDLAGGDNLVYIGFARPGSVTSAPIWKIFMITYSGSTPISILWPVGTDGGASNDYDQIWDDRATLTYV